MSKKIRILEGIRQGKIGGGESYLLSLVENIDRSRFEPMVLSFTNGPMVDRLKLLDIPVKVIYTEKPFDIRKWNEVRSLMKEWEVDLVHAHGTRAASNMFWGARALGLPLIYTCHAWSFHRDQNFVVRKLRIKSEDYLTSKADVNICGSRANRETGRQLFRKGFDAEIIYNSVDAGRFNPNGAYRDLRPELGLSSSDLVIASVARFTLQKQPLKLIRAFAGIAARFENARLLMVGDGELKDEARKLIAKLGISDRIVLESFRQDVPEVLAAADIFVLPSLWEAFPIALLEAMYMGKAVIGTNVDGTPEMIEHERNGLLIGIADMEKELEAALARLCGDAALRKKLREGALETIFNKYNVDTLARKNEAVYQRLKTDKV